MTTAFTVQSDPDSGGVRLAHGAHARILHPLWLRERARDPEQFDPVNKQRLYEPPELPLDLRVVDARVTGPDTLNLVFSDGESVELSCTAMAQELGWMHDPQAPPAPALWDASNPPRPEASWTALGDPAAFREVLGGLFRHGFTVLRDTPTTPGSLDALARHFGFVRDTNFGPIFDVITKPQPIDLAYTGRPLSAHADNPYRRPIPGIQLLHCLANTVEGGLSTVVDGFAVARAIEGESPELFAALTGTPVRFRYEAGGSIMENWGPLVELDGDGHLVRVRFSTRVDYVPAHEPGALDRYYRARRRFYQLANDPAFQIRYTFEPGMLLIVDNHRILHGRTGFDHAAGHRHLQGCYIDHDGPDSLYRVLARDGAVPEASSEAA